jgi:hypothetical protein
MACFGCRLGHEIYYYAQTKTTETIGYNNPKSKETCDASVFISISSYESARETYYRLLSKGWTPMTRDEIEDVVSDAVGYTQSPPPLEPKNTWFYRHVEVTNLAKPHLCHLPESVDTPPPSIWRRGFFSCLLPNVVS